jgi:hypothetical protein
MGRYDALTTLEAPNIPTQPVESPPSKVQQPTKAVMQTHEAKKTSKLANQQTSKKKNESETQEVILPASPTTNPDQIGDTSFLTTKEKTKYGTYLTDESIQKIQIRAIETKRDSHQVLQEAVNQYFEKLAK